jgi:hypothetical protein
MKDWDRWIVKLDMGLDMKYKESLLGVLIRSQARRYMYELIDFCEGSNIKIKHINTDCIVIDNEFLPLFENRISSEIGMLKIE